MENLSILDLALLGVKLNLKLAKTVIWGTVERILVIVEVFISLTCLRDKIQGAYLTENVNYVDIGSFSSISAGLCRQGL